MTYEYEVQGNYGEGWECVTTEDTKDEAVIRLHEYEENEPMYRFRIKKVAKRNEED